MKSHKLNGLGLYQLYIPSSYLDGDLCIKMDTFGSDCWDIKEISYPYPRCVN